MISIILLNRVRGEAETWLLSSVKIGLESKLMPFRKVFTLFYFYYLSIGS